MSFRYLRMPYILSGVLPSSEYFVTEVKANLLESGVLETSKHTYGDISVSEAVSQFDMGFGTFYDGAAKIEPFAFDILTQIRHPTSHHHRLVIGYVEPQVIFRLV